MSNLIPAINLLGLFEFKPSYHQVQIYNALGKGNPPLMFKTAGFRIEIKNTSAYMRYIWMLVNEPNQQIKDYHRFDDDGGNLWINI